MARAPIVDTRFPGRLRRLRQSRGLSLRDLARVTYFSKSMLSELENGHKSPSVETAQHLDRALEAGGELAAMVIAAPIVTTPDDDARVDYVLGHPTQLDGPAVEALAALLAAQRRLDDATGAHVLLPWVTPQWTEVQRLARDGRGAHTGALYVVAAEWTQFAGWLAAEARQDADAVRLLTQAAEQADDIGDGVLAAQVENFRGYLERQRGNPRGIVRHFMAAYVTPGANVLQRIGDAVQAAHGFALLGDRHGAERMLAEASDLAEAADDATPPAIAYWLSPTFSRMGIGLAHLALGNHYEAEQNLRAGLDGLPADQRSAEWTQEYRDALVVAVQ